MVRLLHRDLQHSNAHEETFNPTMVRLLPPFSLSLSNRKVRFQSHNGAIAAERHKEEHTTQHHTFNPTMVRLLLVLAIQPLRVVLPFNPTMVRLLRTMPATMIQVCAELSIPQWCDCCPSPSASLVVQDSSFQSHNGAIAAANIVSMSLAHEKSFNPTMVRLLLECPDAAL